MLNPGEFVILNDVYQPIFTFEKTPTNKYYVHLATVRRGPKEYIAYLDKDVNSVWIEEVDPSNLYIMKRIENDNEWQDIHDFLEAAGLLHIGVDKEIAISAYGITFN